MKNSRIFIVIFLILVSLIFISSSTFAKEIAPHAKEGILILQKYDGEVIKLSGQWEFYWKQLLEPENFEENEHLRSYLNIPHLWKMKK